MEKSNHKNKYRSKRFEYSKGITGDERIIPGNIKLSILFGGTMQFISIIFIISGLTTFIPFFFVETPLYALSFVMIFPLIGLVMLYFSLKKSNKYLRIIITGKTAYGTYITSERTNITINNSPVYRYIFEFTADDGNKYKAAGETHTERLTDEPQELLVYNPNNPFEAVMIDALPRKVKTYILSLTDNDMNDNLIPEN